MKPQLQGIIFQITKSQTNSKVIKVFEYFRHYGAVISLLCMTTSKIGLWKEVRIKGVFQFLIKRTVLSQRVKLICIIIIYRMLL